MKKTIIASLLFLFSIGVSIEGASSESTRAFPNNPAILDESKVSPGQTLVVPVLSSQNIDLIDIDGTTLHTWENPTGRAFYGELLDNGDMVVVSRDPDTKTPAKLVGGYTGILQVIDPAGNVIKEYKDSRMHHDFEVLPNGNIAYFTWEVLPDDFWKNYNPPKHPKILRVPMDLDLRFEAMHPYELKVKQKLTDGITEIDSDGNVVWEWKVIHHLNFKAMPKNLLRNTMGMGYLHLNSIEYLPENPINGDPAYLVSFKRNHTVAIISRVTGQVLWQTGPKVFFLQHDATYLENGNILLYDNGTRFSRVLEYSIEENKIVWQFEGGRKGVQRGQFFSKSLSGAQRLPNGNTLFTLGLLGQVVEVTHDKEIVWEYFAKPHINLKETVWPVEALFKTRRYQLSDEVLNRLKNFEPSESIEEGSSSEAWSEDSEESEEDDSENSDQEELQNELMSLGYLG